jgi:hypothetical protein
MSSLARRIAINAVKGNENPQRAVFSAVVCLADGAEIAAERKRLFEQLAALGRELKEKDLGKLLAFLRRERRGYSAKVDGASPIMQLVDNITALEDLVCQAIERTCVPNPDEANDPRVLRIKK